jgi:hypothetical protein
LIKARNNIGTSYYKTYLDLDSKKDKLFAAGYQPSWDIDFKSIPKIDKNTIIKHKKLSKHLMLPTVSFPHPITPP